MNQESRIKNKKLIHLKILVGMFFVVVVVFVIAALPAYATRILSFGPQLVCIDENDGLIYETNGTIARVYVAGTSPDWSGYIWFNNCGGDPGYWNTNAGKVLFYQFDWNNIPAGDTSFTVETSDRRGTSPCASATFDRATPSGQRVLGLPCYTGGGAQSPSLSVRISWGTGLAGQWCNDDRTCGSNLACMRQGADDICLPITSSPRLDASGASCELNSTGPEWTAAYKPQSGGTAFGYSTAVDATGNVYVTGESLNDVNAASGLDVFVAKFTPSGLPDSSFGIGGVAKYDNNGNESGYGIAVDNSGNVYIAGRTDYADFRGDLLLLKYNSNGVLQFSVSYWLSNGPEIGRAIAIDSSNNVYVTGNIGDSSGGIDMALWRYDSNGNPLGAPITYGIVGRNESASGITLDLSGNIYITGYQSTNLGDMILVKYDTAGNLVSGFGSGGVVVYDSTPVTSFTDSSSTLLSGNNCVLNNSVSSFVSPYNGIVTVTVQNTGSDPSDGLRMKLQCGGVDCSDTVCSTNGRTSPVTLTASSTVSVGTTVTLVAETYEEGNYGLSWSADRKCNSWGGFPYNTAFNTISNKQWQFINPPSAPNTDIGRGVAVSQDGGTVFVDGYQSTNGGDMFLRAYNAANGTSTWSQIYNSGGQNNDVGRAVVAGGAGRVYVAGYQGTNNNDTFLKEYFSGDYQGFLQNTLISSLSYQDIAYGIAINSTNELYVSGYQDSNGGEAFLSKYSCNPPAGGGAASNGYFTMSPTTAIFTGMTVTADATPSGSGISNYAWNWGDSFSGSGMVSTHIYATSGVYQISLGITGGQYDGQTVTQSITVLLNNTPVALFTVSPASGPAPLVVTVNASASDPGAAGGDKAQGDYIKSFSWDWGDGTPKGQGEKTTHLYSLPGIYTIALVVTDLGGLPGTATRQVTVTEQYVCSPSCAGNTPICGPNNAGTANQCYQCLSNTDCGSGYRCLGTPCKSGQMCSDGVTECPADGRCQEATSCKAGTACPDGATCPADGICYSANDKNSCVLTFDTQAAQCYVEVNGACNPANGNADCTAGIQGGVCDTGTSQCRYASCLNKTDFSCILDKDCNNSDGVCDSGVCNYLYDCAYGPGMNSGATTTVAVLAPAMPKMPIGIQPNGEACTKPTPDAPNNCEGINGCLYYSYNGDGTAVTSGAVNNPIGNSVANCVNKFEGGTGCVYYGDQASANSRVNCLPGTDFTKLKSKTAPPGIPNGCVIMDKGNDKKEYDCSGVNSCYYYLDGTVDCDYMLMDNASPPANIGIGCVYEPNPAGAISCPRAFKTPTGGIDFLQCLLNPEATLPSFALGSGADGGPSACRTSADCPAGSPVCINGTCYPQCDASNVNCATGQSCLNTCTTVADCQTDCTPGTICPSGAACQPDSTSPMGGICPANCNAGVCQTGCIPGTICPNGVICPQNGVCPIGGGFSCSDTTSNRNLPYGTPSAPISVSSSQNASCRWSLFDLPFANMSNPFSTSDSINHTATADGLYVGPNIIYTKCDNGAGSATSTVSCNVPLKVGDTCSPATGPCPGNMICLNGWCQAPKCANAQPLGALPYGTQTTGTTISMTTNLNSNCVYSDTYDNTNQCVAPILSCTTATPFATTGGQAHSSFLPGSSLVVGNDTQYVKCQETESSQEKLSDTCQIPFGILACSKEYPCAGGEQCVDLGLGLGVCISPACAGATPTATTTLSYTATNTDITFNTNTLANCAYSDNSNDTYSAMTAFTNTGGQTHSTNIPVAPGLVLKYAKCQETATGDITNACSIRFNVGRSCTSKAQCDGGDSCIRNICVRPVCSGAYPSGQQALGADVTIGLTTDQTSLCRFADTDILYNDMPNVFLSADGLTHGRVGTSNNTVTVTSGNNTKYVGCQKSALPNEITYCRIPFFSGSSCATSFDCDLGMICNGRNCIDDPCAVPDPPPSCFNPVIIVDRCPPFCPPPPPPPPGGGSCNTLDYTFTGTAILPSGNCDLVAIILALLSWLAWIVVLLAVFSGLRAAYLYITSAGDEKKLRLAYHYLIYTTIGVGVAILSFSAVAITRAILNI